MTHAIRLARRLRDAPDAPLDRRAIWAGVLLALLARMTPDETADYYAAIRGDP